MLECPEKPEDLMGAPIGQYHCPYCGMMVMAGLPHPRLIEYRKAEDITPIDMDFLGIPKKSGWYGLLFDYSAIGPFETEEEAEREYRKVFKEASGQELKI